MNERKMEGTVMMKSMFSYWEEKYIKCNNDIILIYENSECKVIIASLSIIGCQVKPIKKQKFHRENVFSLKCKNEQYFFYINDKKLYNDWIKFFRQFGQRPSLLVIPQEEKSENTRKTLLQTFTGYNPEISAFSSKEIVDIFNNLFNNYNCHQSKLDLSELCSKFLCFAAEHIEKHIMKENIETESYQGILFQEIKTQKERAKFLKNMKSKIIIFQQNIQGIYFPLECIFDCKNGKSYYVVCEIKNVASRKLMQNQVIQNKLKLLQTMLDLDNTIFNRIKYIEDSDGKLWILDSSCILKSNERSKNIELFIKELNEGKLFIYDSPSLLQTMKFYDIPISELKIIFSDVKNKNNKVLILNEIISQTCKTIFQDELRKDCSNESITKFFNDILGNSKRSENQIKEILYQKISKIYDIDVQENFEYIRKELLFLSLQYNLGVDFEDNLSYNFNSESPISVEQLLCVHNIPKNFFFDMCLSRNKSHVFNNKYLEPHIFLRDQFFKKSIKILNSQKSILSILFGQNNSFVYHNLAQLCYSCVFNNDKELSKTCHSKLFLRKFTPVSAISSIYLIYESLEKNDIDLFSNVILTNSKIFKYYYGENSEKELEYYIQILKLLNIFKNINIFKRINEFITKNFEIQNPHQQFELFIEQGISYIQRNEPENSNQCLEKAKNVVNNTFGNSSIEYCKYCYEMSNLQILQENYEEALSYSICSYTTIWYKNKERFLFQIIEQIAFICYQLRQYQNSINYYQCLLQYFQHDKNQIKKTLRIIQIIIQEHFEMLKEDTESKSIFERIQENKISNRTAEKQLIEDIISKKENLNVIFSNLQDNSVFSKLIHLFQIAKYDTDSLFDLMN